MNATSKMNAVSNWSKAGSEITDADVNAYVRLVAPDVAVLLRREDRSIVEQEKRECFIGHWDGTSVTSFASLVRTPTGRHGIQGEQHLVENHRFYDPEITLWPDAIAPGEGRNTIAAAVQTLLTVKQYRVFCSWYLDGYPLSDEGWKGDGNKKTASRMLSRCRLALMTDEKIAFVRSAIAAQKKRNAGRIDADYDHWKRLQQQQITTYHKASSSPPKKAHVCDCGAHLTRLHSRHPPRKECYLICGYCGKRHPKSTWKSIYC